MNLNNKKRECRAKGCKEVAFLYPAVLCRKHAESYLDKIIQKTYKMYEPEYEKVKKDIGVEEGTIQYKLVWIQELLNFLGSDELKEPIRKASMEAFEELGVEILAKR